MPGPCSPARPRGYPSRRAAAGPSLRISDADRAAVADRLSQHYGEGRLDESEFNERLDRAMRAKTQSDLAGLLDDLPGSPPAEPGRPRRRRPYHWVLLLALAVVIAAAAGHALMESWLLWLLVVVLAVLWLRHGPRRHRGPGGG